MSTTASYWAGFTLGFFGGSVVTLVAMMLVAVWRQPPPGAAPVEPPADVGPIEQAEAILRDSAREGDSS